MVFYGTYIELCPSMDLSKGSDRRHGRREGSAPHGGGVAPLWVSLACNLGPSFQTIQGTISQGGHRVPVRVWLNDGRGRFTDVAQVVGVTDTFDGRSVALADLSNRGVLDVIVANQEPLWDSPEATWFHDSSGSRITRHFGAAGVQESLNPTSSTLWTEFTNLTAARAASGPFDFNEVDNINWERLNAFYNFSAPGVEVSSDLQLQNGVYSLLQYSKIPVILNGLRAEDCHQGCLIAQSERVGR